MRISLEFEFSKPELTKDYRRCFMSVIKSALSLYNDGILMDKYYDSTKQKDFTWGVILSQPMFQKNKIVLGDLKAKMILSTDDTKQTGYFLFSAFLKLKNMELPFSNGNVMKLKNIRQVPQKILDKKCYIFKLMPGSPLVVRKHDKISNLDTYYSVENEEFEAECLDNLKRQALTAGFTEEYLQTLKIRPISCKKVVVYNYGIYLDATAGMIELEGEPIVLQHFYQNGVCSHRSAGFGMIDVVAPKEV